MIMSNYRQKVAKVVAVSLLTLGLSVSGTTAMADTADAGVNSVKIAKKLVNGV